MLNNKIKIKLVKSRAGASPIQIATLNGLGMTYRGRIKELDNTPCVRGMVKKCLHLLEIVK
jgi:ribosomal protein L30